MRLPESHNALVEAACDAQTHTVGVLSNGSPVEMPWVSRPKAILEAYLGGQAGAAATIDILFGRVNPSFLFFPGEKRKMEYREGLFVRYRHNDIARRQPLFPFGHGLSCTQFEYSDISVDRPSCLDTEGMTLLISVRNIGPITGKEIVQVYVADLQASVMRPKKELTAPLSIQWSRPLEFTYMGIHQARRDLRGGQVDFLSVPPHQARPEASLSPQRSGCAPRPWLPRNYNGSSPRSSNQAEMRISCDVRYKSAAKSATLSTWRHFDDCRSAFATRGNPRRALRYSRGGGPAR